MAQDRTAGGMSVRFMLMLCVLCAVAFITVSAGQQQQQQWGTRGLKQQQAEKPEATAPAAAAAEEEQPQKEEVTAAPAAAPKPEAEKEEASAPAAAAADKEQPQKEEVAAAPAASPADAPKPETGKEEDKPAAKASDEYDDYDYDEDEQQKDSAAKAGAGDAAKAADDQDDVDKEGACKAAIQALCEGVEDGPSELANCLADSMREADSGEDTGHVVSEACQEEVMQFKIAFNKNIYRNKRIARACKADADKHCSVSTYNGFRNGTIIGCLRDIREKLQGKCAKEIFRFQLDVSYDYRADPMLYETCSDDAAKHCKDVKPGGGRIQACLMKPETRLQLSWDCDEQLFRKELEDSDDMRLSIRLFNKCLGDKKQFCSDVPPGHALAKQCLEEHREELSDGCREEIDSMIERRMRDFRLDTRLRKACEHDILTTCAYVGDPEAIDSAYDNSVADCLQDYKDEIHSDECKASVQHYLQLASQDIRFDVPLAEACGDDRRILCANVPPGDARVIRCLQTQRDKLTSSCRATLFDEEVRFSENIDFNYPMKRACEREVARFCKDVPHGNARTIRCLQENKANKDFGKACLAEVQRYEQLSAKDFRLNHRLSKLCRNDVGALCKDVCKVKEGDVCGGKVLSCLAANEERINSTACKKEVFYYLKMGVEDFRNDVALAEACRPDVDKLCADVEPGEGRIHACLQDNREKLSAQCRKEEMRLEVAATDNVELNTSVLRACKDERSLFCRRVSTGQARVFRCLVENMGSADFGDTCKMVIMTKLVRRQANWRLDPPLRRSCRENVAKLCAEEDASGSELGVVKKCLVSKAEQLDEECRRELGRSLHMAFFVWYPGGIMTAPCDEDIQKQCLAQSKGLESTPGAVGSCLQDIVMQMRNLEPGSPAERRRHLLQDDKQPQANRKVEPGNKVQQQPKPQQQQQQKPAAQPKAQPKPQPAKAQPKAQPQQQKKKPPPPPKPQLSQQCLALVDLAEAPAPAAQEFDPQLGYNLLTAQLQRAEGVVGVEMVNRNVQGAVTGVNLTGWLALLGVGCLVLVLCGGAVMGVRYFLGRPEAAGYTLVQKTASAVRH